MCWAHHFWLTIILSFHLYFFFPFPDCVLMPLLGANSCSAFFHRPRERCDPERLTASSIYTMLSIFFFDFHRNTPTHPCSVLFPSHLVIPGKTDRISIQYQLPNIFS